MKDKRTEKIKKHYNILVDGKSFKIMNYIISNDNKILNIRTKIRGQIPPTDSVVIIEIPISEKSIILRCKWKALLSKPTLEEWEFEIID